jgi:O-antigen ligase
VGRALLAGARYKHPYLFTHPNVSCMMAGLSALVLVALAAGGVRGGWRRTALAAGLAVDLAFLVVMGSRGPQIVFAAALLAYPLLLVPGWKARLSALLAVAAVGTGLWLGAGRINPRLADATMDGFNGRDIVWRYVVKLVPEHPVRGFGYGKRSFKKVAYHDHSRRPLQYRPAYYPHAHCYWLMLVFQGGAVAVVLWGGGWLALLAGLACALRRAGQETAGTPWRQKLEARALPAFFLAAIGMVLLYATGDYPDNLMRDVQFALPALALAWAWPPRRPAAPEGAAP